MPLRYGIPPEYKLVEPEDNKPVPPLIGRDLVPNSNANMRSSVPPTPFTSDSATQFYRDGSAPQYRAFSLPPLYASSGANASIATGTGTASSSSSSTVINNTVSLSVSTASLTTSVLVPNGQFTTSLSLATVGQVVQVATSQPARVRLYGTALAQTLDLTRGANDAPAFETTSSVFMDVSLDTAPYIWQLTPIAQFSNGDSPQVSTGFLTVDNIGTAVTAIVVSLSYVKIVP